MCKKTDKTQVHHVRKLAELDMPGQPRPEWVQIMARRRRKTLVVCQTCHERIHEERHDATPAV
jgi:hypothetical protein